MHIADFWKKMKFCDTETKLFAVMYTRPKSQHWDQGHRTGDPRAQNLVFSSVLTQDQEQHQELETNTDD